MMRNKTSKNHLNGGDAVRHPSRLVSHGGEKRAEESRFATLNVRGGMEAKIDEVCQMMNERKIDILCVNETKRKGCEIGKYGAYTAYWSGVPETARCSQGVGLILSERMTECVNEYVFVSPRLVWLRLKVGLTRIFVLGVYAPTDVGTSSSRNTIREREEFWANVRDVLQICKQNERLIMLGDFNGWVGVNRKGYERVLGSFGDPRVNANGRSLLEICVEMNLCVTNTMFAHKKIHSYTWENAMGKSMIDFVIVDERLKKNVIDTRSFRGVGLDTDHFLVVCRIKGLFKKWRSRIPEQSSVLERIKVEHLQGDVKEKYEIILNDKLKGLDETCEIEEVWNKFKKEVVNVAVDICGTSKRKKCCKRRNVWWDKDVQAVVSEKKKAWRDWFAMRANQQNQKAKEEDVRKAKLEYNRKKGVVKELVKKKKDEEKDIFDERLSNDFQKNIKFFWKTIRSARGKLTTSELGSVRDKNGNLVNGEEYVLKRWKEYFEGLFERENTHQVLTTMDEREEYEDRIGMGEIMKALKTMKIGKAAGYDRVSVEMLKAGGGAVARPLCHLLNLCWSKGVVPSDWCNAVIVPLYKGKGSKQDCQSYRGISLLSVVGKLYAKVLIERVMKETNDKLWDVQAGFRKGMGCTDQVFSLRSVVEKSLAKGQKVFCAFVDLEKAYDRVVRNELWAALSKFGLSDNLIRALQSLYKDSSACVRINGAYTDRFRIDKGVRQGCVASPWLFNLFMDGCLQDLKDSEYGLRMNELSLKCLLYADDQVILASSEEELQSMVIIMNEAFERKGMKINVSKTKVMVFERNDRTNCNIMIGNESLEQVEEFVYLGCVFTSDGKHDSDIERRVNAGNRVNGALRTFMGSRKVSKKARLAVHRGVLAPTLMYGSESWVWQKKHESKVRAVEMRSLRSVCGVSLCDRVRNSVVMEMCGMKEDIVTRIEKGMLRWFGHVQRMDESRVTKQVYEASVSGEVGRGRPSRTYNNQVQDLLKKGQVKSTRNRRECMKRLMNVEEAKEVCQDRAKWRSIVSAYPYGIQA